MKDYRKIGLLTEAQELDRIIGAMKSFIHHRSFKTAKEAVEAFTDMHGDKYNPSVFSKNVRIILKEANSSIIKAGRELWITPKGTKNPQLKRTTFVQDLDLEEWKATHPNAL